MILKGQMTNLRHQRHSRKNRLFTPQEDQYIKDHWGKDRLIDIAFFLKRDKGAVYSRGLGKLGLPKKKSLSVLAAPMPPPPPIERANLAAVMARPAWFEDYSVFKKRLTAGR
jgi:hypothetical protein